MAIENGSKGGKRFYGAGVPTTLARSYNQPNSLCVSPEYLENRCVYAISAVEAQSQEWQGSPWDSCCSSKKVNHACVISVVQEELYKKAHALSHQDDTRDQN